MGYFYTVTPVDFGWDVQHVSESEKEGFRMRQEILVNNYEWFRKSHPNGFWLRSVVDNSASSHGRVR